MLLETNLFLPSGFDRERFDEIVMVLFAVRPDAGLCCMLSVSARFHAMSVILRETPYLFDHQWSAGNPRISQIRLRSCT